MVLSLYSKDITTIPYILDWILFSWYERMFLFRKNIYVSFFVKFSFKLKTGDIALLLRNLYIINGLCNGTRDIRRLYNNSVDAEVLTGNAIGLVIEYLFQRWSLQLRAQVCLLFYVIQGFHWGCLMLWKLTRSMIKLWKG